MAEGAPLSTQRSFRAAWNRVDLLQLSGRLALGPKRLPSPRSPGTFDIRFSRVFPDNGGCWQTAAVKMGSRTRFLSTLLSVLALIGQMMLPAAHAASMARQQGDPLASAFCGPVSAATAAHFRAVAPKELLDQFEKSRAKSFKPACDLCASSSGNDLIGAVQITLALVPPASAAIASEAQRAAPHVQLFQLPQLRAPPQTV